VPKPYRKEFREDVVRIARNREPGVTLEQIAAACPEMTALADLVHGFAALLKPAEGNDVKLTKWITAARAVDLPHLRSLTNGIEIDRVAVDAGLTLPYHNGRTEGVNTRTKRIMRQMHGRAGFDFLRHRILLP
jgi:transposase